MSGSTAEAAAPTAERPVPPKPRLSLSAQVFIALGLGILAGLFFGELVQPLQVVGQVFIGLLQMTVLPYILVSLIAGIGKLSYPEMRMLAVQGGRIVLVFWAIALAITVAFTATLPDWESATFFSSSLVETPEPADLVELYIPSNPFFSLSGSIVPAIVLFSLAIGLAIIGVPNKGHFIDNLDVLGEAIMRIAGFVARLAPIGVFALIATAAGTLDVDALGRLQVYILTYIGAALLLSFWVLPALVGVLTPIKSGRMLSACQDALVTAFATGSLLIVLPLLAERMKELLREARISTQEGESAVDLVVPINFNLPNLGKLMSLAFVPFAGWFAGSSVSLEQFPLFLVSGLLSFFGEVVVALPFLLDLMQIPADMFQLFLAVDVFTGRFGTLLAGVHTIVLGLLTAAAVSGQLRWHWPRLSRYLLVSAVLTIALFGGLRFFFEVVVPQEYREYEKLVTMDLAVTRVDTDIVVADEIEPLNIERGSRMAAIRERGVLRVGYLQDALPFMYRNDKGRIVGLEADLAHLLAGELGVDLKFVEVENRDIGRQLKSGRIDIMMGGLLITPERALEVHFTQPHLNSTLALIVADHDRSRFDSNKKLRALSDVRIAAVNLPYYGRFVNRHLPDIEIVELESSRQFFTAEPGEYDALLFSAEAGSAWTIIHPRYSVVVPKPRTITAPIALGLPRDAPLLADFVETWLTLQREAGVLDRLQAYWIHGEGAESTEPRWSVIRNVLGWME
jgi:Na+/H+-dicarboxylate symporter/ABC-type amino acid transport substrate-binding protein